MMMAENPTRAIDVSFSAYLNKRKELTESHMQGGIPDYAYGSDYAMRQKIRALPGVFAFFKALTSQVVPREKQETNLRGLKVGPSQFSDVYEQTVECARILGIGIPTVFILSDASVNAYAVATEDDAPLIVINSGLLERFTPGELKYVIGHECGHIHNNHSIYNIAARIIISSMTIAIPGVSQIIGLLTAPIQLALQAWSRAGEVTCDRAGVICCDDPADAQTACAKFMYGGTFNRDEVNIEAILKQYDTLSATPVRMLELLNTHPLPVRRIFAIKAFLDSDILYTWRPEWKQPGKQTISKEELDARCTKFIGVVKSEKRS